MATAERVFAKLKRAAGVNVAASKLVVIDTVGSPWAVALADGNVVLTLGALEIIFGNKSKRIQESWLAFVLGHELAHLGSRDLWQQQAFSSLAGLSPEENSALHGLQEALRSSAFDMKAWRERELKADETGYVLASLAGFDVQNVFASNDSKDDFLRVWEESTKSRGQTHYSAQVRSEFLQTRMLSAERRIDQFKLATMLAHFGLYEDALVLLQDFQNYFSSSQSLVNLGFIHLQLARQQMSPDLAYRYWIPETIEAQSGIRVPSRGYSGGLSKAATRHLKQAVTYLQKSHMLDHQRKSTDVNLAIAYFYLGKHYRARAVLEDALEQYPGDATLSMLRALVMVDQEPDIDMWPRAVAILEGLESDSSIARQVEFNLARMNQERGRVAVAQQIWQRLFRVKENMPGNYRAEVCKAMALRCEASLPDIDISHTGIQPGDNLNDERLAEVLAASQVNRWQVQEISGVTLKTPEATAFAFNGVVELVSYRAGSEALRREIWQGLAVLDHSPVGKKQITRYSSGISVVEEEGEVVEVWRSL